MRSLLLSNNFFFFIVYLGLLLSPNLSAHQSENFIKILGSSLDTINTCNFSKKNEWIRDNKNTYLIQPSFSYGINNFINADIHALFEGSNNSKIELQEIALQFKTFSHKEYLFFNWGAALEIARLNDIKSSTHSKAYAKPRFHSAHHNTSTNTISNNEYFYELTLINSKDWINLELSSQISSQWLNSTHFEEYGIGIRSKSPLGLAIEFLGAFYTSSRLEIWTSIRKEITHHFSLQLGFGQGLGSYNNKQSLALTLNLFP